MNTADSSLAVPGRRLLVDVSTIWGTRKAKPTGIPRVEYEAARCLRRSGAVPVIYDADAQGFLALDDGDFAEMFEQADDIRSAKDLCLQPPGPTPRRALLKTLALWCFWALSSLLGTRRMPGRVSRKLAVRLFGALAPGFGADNRRRWVWLLGLEQDAQAMQLAVNGYMAALHQARRQKLAGQRIALGGNDILFLLGATWEFHDLARLRSLKETAGFQVVALIYDLVPIRHPELQPESNDFESRFIDYLRQTLHLADRLTAISAYVAQDVEAYAREQGLPAKPVAATPLCSDLDVSVEPALTPRLADIGLHTQPYALFVSTISPRKNHLWAYKLWKRIVAQHGDKAIPLVFAGARGWLSKDLFAILTRDRAMWGRKLIYIETPSDEELAWLYRNCAFTLYPSEFEGWGLPITESLSYGKYCLAADNTALREASQNLAFHADLLDGRAWEAEIARLLDDPSYAAGHSRRIAENFHKRTWADLGAELLAEARALPRPPAIGN